MGAPAGDSPHTVPGRLLHLCADVPRHPRHVTRSWKRPSGSLSLAALRSLSIPPGDRIYSDIISIRRIRYNAPFSALPGLLLAEVSGHIRIRIPQRSPYSMGIP